MADELTDEQLRKELAAFGEKSIGPITDSTRSLYIKKLNRLRATHKKGTRGSGKATPDRRLIGFSSDESEDEQTARTANSRRKTTRAAKADSVSDRASGSGSASLSRPSLRRRRGADKEDPIVPASTSSGRGRGRGTSAAGPEWTLDRSRRDPDDDFESSDSDIGTENTADLASRGTNTSSSLDSSSVVNRTFSKSSSHPGTNNTTPRSLQESGSRGTRLGRQGSGARTSTPENRLLKENYGSTLSRGDGSRDPSVKKSTRGHILSNSVHKSSGNHVVPTKNAKVADDEANILRQGFKTREDPSSYKYTQYISMVLCIVVALFFAVLAFSYLNLKGNGREASSMGDSRLPCVEEDNPSKEKKCVRKATLDGAQGLVAAIFDRLSQQSGLYDCGYDDVDRRNLSLREVTTYLKLKFPDLDESAKDGNMTTLALDLIAKNPHWAIRLMDKEGKATTDPQQVERLECDIPHLPFLCRIQKAVARVFFGLCLTAAGVAALLLILVIARHKLRVQEEEKLKMYRLVEMIIDILKSHHEGCQANKDMQPFMAIPHVRDMLISPGERKQFQPLWDKAVKFLSANESRIRVETQVIEGEEFPVWRWLHSVPNGGKVWQGQAFGEHKDTGLNMPPCSPTPCLKIRNMFDADMEYGDDWPVYIEDAVLEKCKDVDNIVHVAVDKGSREGCVYMKCTSPPAAGCAYRALHGWWFDGNLVTVKYLRLERYHERFPEAADFESPLKPSNNKMLSMSQPYHRSMLETS